MRRILISFICFLASSAANTAAPLGPPPPPPTITILTGNHITRPLVPLARAYAREKRVAITSARVNSNVEEQISQGLEAHLLLTADQGLLTRLNSRGLADVNASKPFAVSRLALVTTHSGAARMELAKHISFAATIAAAPDLPIYLESQLDEVGSRSAILLKGYEFSPTLNARAKTMNSHRELLAELRETGGLALMLTSDAASEPDMVVLSTAPDTLMSPVPFYAVILASESMDQARAFANYLTTPSAGKLLTQGGFEPTLND